MPIEGIQEPVCDLETETQTVENTKVSGPLSPFAMCKVFFSPFLSSLHLSITNPIFYVLTWLYCVVVNRVIGNEL